MLINADNVAFSYDGNLIFRGVGFSVDEKDKIGLVGENGVGKTTLIKLMLGYLSPDSGEIFRKNGISIGYLPQNGGYDGDGTVYGEMRAVFSRETEAVEKLEKLMIELSQCGYASGEYNSLSAKIEGLQAFVASHDCYNIDVRIKTVLNGMGFADFYGRRISDMSGGEKTRLLLARLLLENHDLLILDEPTNHLDVKTLFWLEDYLASYKGALFIVSHDRYFLDRVTSSTAEIENGVFTSYRGNYSKYKQLKALSYERALKEYESQQEEIKKLQTYIDKNIVRATTAKSAQSRVKQLERLELKQKPYTPPQPPRFDFSYTQQPAEEVVKIEGLDLKIGGKSLICGGQLTIRRGDKIAIVGDNGAGKSTLLRAIINAEEGISIGRYVTFSYYDQEMASLDKDNTVLQELWGRHIAYSQTQARAALARCGLFAEDMDKKVGELSGGERAKLSLCVFANTGGNVLVLDEPTNHLDLPARESLEKSLCAFEGTVIFVSHDRYFISAVAQKIAEIENRKLTVYGGGYAQYKAEKDSSAQQREQEKIRAQQNKDNRGFHRSGKDRAEQAKINAEIKRIEAEISLAEQEENSLNLSLADPAVAADYKQVAIISEKLDKVRANLENLYARYGQIID